MTSLGDQERIQGTARETLRRLVDQTSTSNRDAAERAVEFLLFKLWAANHAREAIIRTIQEGVTSLRYMLLT